MLKYVFIMFSSSLIFISVEAQTCGSGGCPLSNTIGLDMLDKGVFQLNLSYDYNNLNTLNSGNDKLDDNSRLRITNSVLLNTSYSITKNLAVEGLLSWVEQRRVITQFGNENVDVSNGIGDGVLLVKYNFKDVLSKNSSIIVGMGAKIPLGSTTEKNEQGIILNADMQPGTGAWDAIYWSQLSMSFEFRSSLNFSIRATYRGTGENDSYLDVTTYEFGNEFQSFLSITDEFEIFNTSTIPSVTVKYRTTEKDKIGGFDLDNTGGEWVFLALGLSVDVSSNVSISTKGELPIYSYVDGTQLTPTYRITTGVLYKIPTKKRKNEFNILENEK